MAKGKGGGGLSLYPFSVCEGAKILLATPATGRRTERPRSGVGGTCIRKHSLPAFHTARTYRNGQSPSSSPLFLSDSLHAHTCTQPFDEQRKRRQRTVTTTPTPQTAVETGKHGPVTACSRGKTNRNASSGYSDDDDDRTDRSRNEETRRRDRVIAWENQPRCVKWINHVNPLAYTQKQHFRMPLDQYSSYRYRDFSRRCVKIGPKSSRNRNFEIASDA